MKRVEKNEKIAKTIEKEKKIKIYKTHAKTITKVILISMIIIFSFFYYIRFIEPTMLFVKEVKIESPLIPKSLSGLKIVHFSDLHYKMTSEKQELTKLIKKINELKPDIVVFTGDLLEEEIKYTTEDYELLNTKLNEIEVTMAKYYIKGHTDYFTEKTEIILQKSNFISLNNNNDKIYGTSDEKIQIIGLGSLLKDDFNIEKGFENIEAGIYTIALFHEPDGILKLKDYPIQLALAGHSHHNQIQIPFITNLLKKEGAKTYFNNHYQIEDTQLFINSGIGTTTYKYRLLTPPTVNLYRFVHTSLK